MQYVWKKILKIPYYDVMLTVMILQKSKQEQFLMLWTNGIPRSSKCTLFSIAVSLTTISFLELSSYISLNY